MPGGTPENPDMIKLNSTADPQNLDVRRVLVNLSAAVSQLRLADGAKTESFNTEDRKSNFNFKVPISIISHMFEFVMTLELPTERGQILD